MSNKTNTMNFNMLEYLEDAGDIGDTESVLLAHQMLEDDINNYINSELCEILREKTGITSKPDQLNQHLMLSSDAGIEDNTTVFYFENGVPGGIELATFKQIIKGGVVYIHHY